MTHSLELLTISAEPIYNAKAVTRQNVHPELIAEVPGTFLGETLRSGITTIEQLMNDRKKQ